MEPQAVSKALEALRAKAKAKVGSEVPWAPCGNLLIGAWLQSSVFLWPRGHESRLSAWLPGLLISVISLLSLGAPPMRWLNAFVALWLILWTMAATSSEPLAYFNGVASGLLVLVLAALPSKTAAGELHD